MWKKVSEFPELYEVSNLGRVRSVDSNKANNLEWCNGTYNNLYGSRLERFKISRGIKSHKI